MNKPNIKLPEKDQMILAVSNGDGSFQMIAMTEQQSQLVNIAIASVSSSDEPFYVSPIKLVAHDCTKTY